MYKHTDVMKNSVILNFSSYLCSGFLIFSGPLPEARQRDMPYKILITGATGFIGGFIVDEALRRGMEVWAAVRRSSSRARLTDPRIHFVELNLDDAASLAAPLAAIQPHYVVHAAGVTKCLDVADFRRVNTLGTLNLVTALRSSCPALKRLVYLSSLSSYGPVRERRPYGDITSADPQCPDTAYGRSKMEGEKLLDTICGGDDGHAPMPYVILCPTGVYGPYERDYFMMAKSIKSHVDFAVGYRPQELTFIYVLDVVQAVFLALGRGRNGARYLLSDGNVYSSRTFSNLIRRELGVGLLLRIKAPIWFLRIVTFFGEHAGRITGRVTALNNDKFHIMKQRNWRCDIAPAVSELGYRPQYDLPRGVQLTMRWYKEHGWL